ncbi:TetR/AcrR family transcriptional regulator C-terminal domain-containing protein [Streptomyces sp. NPDC057686]|uniref:TetR/AcrR family transcriptional regulator C-terminal domain-containing protein n=1 Tax=Streptomyces sp. NPDC057686 TaxID=3346212 RepID=UPI0036C3DD3B
MHAYVLASVAAQQALRRAEQRTGLSEERWQRSVGPYISEVLAAGEPPMLARHVLEAEELDPDVEFAFGLDCVLDGLAARLGR